VKDLQPAYKPQLGGHAKKGAWGVGPSSDDVRVNRANRPTNGSDGVHRTGCVAPKDQQSPQETQSTKAAGQANDEGNGKGNGVMMPRRLQPPNKPNPPTSKSRTKICRKPRPQHCSQPGKMTRIFRRTGLAAPQVLPNN